jgi:hypothetical protein
MMDEADTFLGQFAGQLLQIRFDEICFHMHQRIEAECEINPLVRYHRERYTVIYVVSNIRTTEESLLAGSNTTGRQIDNEKMIAQVLQKLGPAPVPRRDFQTRTRWDEIANSGQNSTTPLLLGSAPLLGPIVTAVGPGIVNIPRQPIPFDRLYGSRSLSQHSRRGLWMVILCIPLSKPFPTILAAVAGKTQERALALGRATTTATAPAGPCFIS